MCVVILEDQCWTKTNGSVSTASQNNTWNEHRIGPLVISMFAKYPEKFRSLNEDNPTVEGQQKLPKSCWPTPWYSTLWREWPQASQQLRITLGAWSCSINTWSIGTNPDSNGKNPSSTELKQHLRFQSCSTLLVRYLGATTRHRRFLCNLVFKLIGF